MSSSSPTTLYGYIRLAFFSIERDLDRVSIEALRDDNLDFSTSTPIHSPLALIFYLDYDTRKFLLDFTRIQNPVSINKTLSATYANLLGTKSARVYVPTGRKLNSCRLKSDIRSFLWNTSLASRKISTTILFFVLSFRTLYARKGQFIMTLFVETARKVIDKEIKATQLPNRPQQLDYRCLYADDRVPLLAESEMVPKRTIHLWKSHIQTLIHK